MFEFVSQFVSVYGLTGLFFGSLLASTIFIPFSVELLLPPLIASGVSPSQVLFVSILGSTIGVWVNYLLGYYGIKVIYRYVKHADILKAKKVMDKYGWFGVIFIIGLPIPIPTDPITVLCGMSEMNPVEFTIAVLIGKFIKYGIAVGIFSIIL